MGSYDSQLWDPAIQSCGVGSHDSKLWDPTIQSCGILRFKSLGSYNSKLWDPTIQISGILQFKSLGSYDLSCGPVPDKWIALLLRPGKEILVAEQVPCEGFIVLIGPRLARPKEKKASCLRMNRKQRSALHFKFSTGHINSKFNLKIIYVKVPVTLKAKILSIFT